MKALVAVLALAFGSALGGALATGCTHSIPPVNVLHRRVDETHKATYNGLALRSGQLVLTESPDTTSYAFVLIPKKFRPFTHVAVVVVEGGEPWVYDITGEIKTLPLRSRMLDNVRGKMFRRRFFEYVAPNLYAEIYDPPAGADPDKLAAFVKAKYAEGVEFDGHFDFADHKTMFCTELVELAIRHAGGPAQELEESNPNPSIVESMKWLGVPPGVVLPAGRYAEPSRYVGALGQFPTRTAAWAYFEAKRELHRRFTADQRIGYMLSVDKQGRIDVRPEITAFTINASHLFDAEKVPPEPGDPRITEAVRKLAADTFGPFPVTPFPVTPEGGAESARTSAR